MGNRIREGIERLKTTLIDFASEEAAYHHGNTVTNIHVVAGRLDVVEDETLPASIISRLRDFYVSSDELPETPKVGDMIAIGNTHFEVLNVGGVCWRWSDPYQTMRKIHTKAKQ